MPLVRPPGIPSASAAAADELRRIVRALAVSSLAVEKATGLSGAQAFVLRTLLLHGDATPSELAARTLTDASSVTGVVGKLLDKALVARRRDPEDGRRVVLSLRAKGRALARRTPVPVQERLVAAVAELRAEDARALARSLRAIVAAMGAADRAPTLFFEEPAATRGRRP